MAIEKVLFTKEGLERLQKELDHLKIVERPTTTKAIADARALGDLSENADYHAARERQGFIEARIAELEDKLSRGEVIDYSNRSKPSEIMFGAFVTLEDEDSGEEKRYQIVGDLESDISANRISMNSPIGRALLGKKQDDLVVIRVPKGEVEYTVKSVAY